MVASNIVRAAQITMAAWCLMVLGVGYDASSVAGQVAAGSTIPTAPDLEMSSMSIVGFDPETGDLGIALASRFFAVAPVAAHVRAGVGAVATMGGAPYADADMMLDMLESGVTPDEVLARLRLRHPEGIGQLNIVDAAGRSVSTTSRTQAREWKGHLYGRNYAAAGNVLAGPWGQDHRTVTGWGCPLASE